jgi:hypothetical protein
LMHIVLIIFVVLSGLGRRRIPIYGQLCAAARGGPQVGLSRTGAPALLHVP